MRKLSRNLVTSIPRFSSGGLLLWRHFEAAMALSQEDLRRLFQSYESVGILGRGQYGSAILLRSPSTGDMVVSKQIGVDGMSVDEMRKVENERRILELLQHENVISFLCSWSEPSLHGGGGVLHLVMEYAEGGTLADQLVAQADSGEPFPTAVVHRWMGQLCSALQHMHSHRILHRDLKTQNVFLTASADLKVGDFGISKALSTHTNLAETVCGTPYYLSPELVMGQPYKEPSDVWSLGVIMFELLTFHRPFTAPNIGFLILKISSVDYDETLLHSCPHPRALSDLPTRTGLLHKDPSERLTLSELSTFLRAFIPNEDIRATEWRPRLQVVTPTSLPAAEPWSAQQQVSQAAPAAAPPVGVMPPHMAASVLQRAHRRRVQRELAELAELHQMMHGGGRLDGGGEGSTPADEEALGSEESSGRATEADDDGAPPPRLSPQRAIITVKRSTPPSMPIHPRRPDAAAHTAKLAATARGTPSPARAASVDLRESRGAARRVPASSSDGTLGETFLSQRRWDSGRESGGEESGGEASARPSAEGSSRRASAVSVELEPLPLPKPPVPRHPGPHALSLPTSIPCSHLTRLPRHAPPSIACARYFSIPSSHLLPLPRRIYTFVSSHHCLLARPPPLFPTVGARRDVAPASIDVSGSTQGPGSDTSNSPSSMVGQPSMPTSPSASPSSASSTPLGADLQQHRRTRSRLFGT
ncbi:hypothetical protein AB1Y20_022379 [Prymnesium parvum]|uniref:non-specific serine/threonine protein kinase n=1 Tax=Prymnesium parvum TaxID=97485 RepID=A0AB34JIU4_PRYPA